MILSDSNPYELAINDVTAPLWSPTAAPAQLFMSGGPPFSLGAMVGSLVYRGFDAVKETIPLQIRGADVSACITALNTLRKILLSGTLRSPMSLLISMAGAPRGANFLVFHADVQENPSFFSWDARNKLLRTQVTIIRSVHSYSVSSTTLQTAQTVTNNANSSPPNYLVMDGVPGEFAYAGTPISWSLAPQASGMLSGSGIQKVYAGTIVQPPTFINTNDAISTTSTSGTTIATENVTLTRGGGPARFRIISRITSPTANLEVQVQVVYGDNFAGSGATIWTSDWKRPGSAGDAYIDFGDFAFPNADSYFTTSVSSNRIITRARSTNGAAATGTWANMEILLYRTWAIITSLISLSNVALSVSGFSSILGTSAAIPMPDPQVVFRYNGSITGVILDYPEVRGDLPIGVEDTYLYLATTTGAVHDQTDTGTVSIAAAPLYMTL